MVGFWALCLPHAAATATAPTKHSTSPELPNDSEESLAWDFCKTAFKPYDLAVCVFLVIAKHYLDENMSVESDGTRENWADAIEICQTVLGYGEEFTLESEAEEDEDEQDW